MAKLIWGRKTVLAAIADKQIFDTIYVAVPPRFSFNKNIQQRRVSMQMLDTMTKSADHEGIAARIIPFQYFPLSTVYEDNPSAILILDHIKKPQNLGAIIRSTNAAGLVHIIIAEVGAASVTRDTYNIASGGMTGMKIIRVKSIEDAINELKINGFNVACTALTPTAKPVLEAKLARPLALVMGSEGKGASAEVMALADELIYIPMYGKVQSLNVSVATGIMLFTLNRFNKA